MNREDLMFLLEGIAYISGSLAAFVYVFDTYIQRLNKHKKIERGSSTSSRISLTDIYNDNDEQ
jgi:hypothetical protein